MHKHRHKRGNPSNHQANRQDSHHHKWWKDTAEAHDPASPGKAKCRATDALPVHGALGRSGNQSHGDTLERPEAQVCHYSALLHNTTSCKACVIYTHLCKYTHLSQVVSSINMPAVGGAILCNTRAVGHHSQQIESLPSAKQASFRRPPVRMPSHAVPETIKTQLCC